MKRVKIGQVGIGHNHGSAKMAAVRKRPDLFEVVGFSESDEKVFAERGEKKEYSGLKRMTEDEIIEKCDAVLVETGVPYLTKTAQKCIDAGKHIHMDKPASGTLEEYKKLVDDAERKKLTVQLGYMYRYNPAVKKAVELARSGALGKITMINAEMSTYHSRAYKEWLSGFKGGIMYILGSHLVDIAAYILGEPDKITAFMKHTGFENIDFADNDLAVLEYGSTLVRIFVSSVEVNGWGRRQLVISGTDGCIDIKPIENTTHVTFAHKNISTNPYEDMKEILPINDIPKNERYDEMMSDFYLFVTGQKENPYSYRHEYTVQKILNQICERDGF